MSVRGWLCFCLTVWLSLTLARQTFDLIGRLWIPVGFNLLQLVCIITGLFGAAQGRVSLLIALAVSCLLSLVQNMLITLWYLGVFGDRGRSVLSAGLPFSFSFFLKYTPGCESQYDLARSRWVQSSCYVSYYYVEAAQAILHMVIATVVAILTVVNIFSIRKVERERQKKVVSKASTVSSLGSRAHYAQVKRGPLPEAPSSVNDQSSGYMNSSYEDIAQTRQTHIHEEIEERPPTPPELPRMGPRISYERNSKKSRTKIRPKSTTTVPEDFYTKPQKSGKASGRFKKAAETEPRRGTLTESVTGSDRMTSLVSFDPKSGTLLRVREHMESEDDRFDDEQEMGVDVSSVYEQIREKPRLNVSSDRRSLKDNRNSSHDSVPSIMAPVLMSPPNNDASSSDSGVLSSTQDWPPPPMRVEPWRNKDPVWQPAKEPLWGSDSPGIRLSDQLRQSRTDISSPGIRLMGESPKQPHPNNVFPPGNMAPLTSRGAPLQDLSPRGLPLQDSKPHGLPLREDLDHMPVINGNSLLV